MENFNNYTQMDYSMEYNDNTWNIQVDCICKYVIIGRLNLNSFVWVYKRPWYDNILHYLLYYNFCYSDIEQLYIINYKYWNRIYMCL